MTAKGRSQRSAAEQDALLVARWVQGDGRVFDRIVSLHQRRIAQLAYRLLGWPDEVEDVVQEVFLKVLKNLPNYRGQSSLQTWMTVITVNVCRTWRRKRLLRLRRLKSLVSRLPEPPPATNTADGTINTDTFEQVRRAVQRLPGRYREVLVLRYLEQLPIAQIAEILHLARNNVDVRLNRARTLLRDHLADLIE
ncbi:MAG: RNA polymerase sigma factor [Sedimentisphaerales bacterium]|nr:RNA polymerase sigma factor [Sedimentisphaerales bacterium]